MSIEPQNTERTRPWQGWRGFFLFIAIMLVFRSAIADWNQVPSGSMKPSILVGDRIVVDKLAYDLRVPFTLRRLARWAEPRRGDVVTFPSPIDERLNVKRILGLPGDVVELRDNHLVINGQDADYAELSHSDVEAIELLEQPSPVALPAPLEAEHVILRGKDQHQHLGRAAREGLAPKGIHERDRGPEGLAR